MLSSCLFFFTFPPTSYIYTLSLHDALPISLGCVFCETGRLGLTRNLEPWEIVEQVLTLVTGRSGASVVFQGDRKSTRLNSSHLGISYAVFCLKKKNITDQF